MKDLKRERKLGRILGLSAGIAILLAALFLATSLCAAEGPAIPSIFKPESTPADSSYHLALFVLAITAIIFVIVFSLLVYAATKFRRRSEDGPEPPQVYGSNQIEIAWTVIPVLIVLVLFMATARVIHAIQDARMPKGAIEVTVIGHQYWWEFRYPAVGDRHRKRAACSGQRSIAPFAHFLEITFRRYGSQLLGSAPCGKDRLDSESRKQNVGRSSRCWSVRRAVLAILRDAARQDALASLCRFTVAVRAMGASRKRRRLSRATRRAKASEFLKPLLASTAIPFPEPWLTGTLALI